MAGHEGGVQDGGEALEGRGGVVAQGEEVSEDPVGVDFGVFLDVGQDGFKGEWIAMDVREDG